MFHILGKFGFENSFIRWIKLLYNNVTSMISNSGWLSVPFNISRGIRQGCPLSALLFVIVAEIMAIKIRSLQNIQGIEVKSQTTPHFIKICQLADDTTLFLKDENDIIESLRIVDEFGMFSGLKLNRSKTEGM